MGYFLITQLVALLIWSGFNGIIVKWLSRRLFDHRVAYGTAFGCIFFPAIGFFLLGIPLGLLSAQLASNMGEPENAEPIASALSALLMIPGFFIQAWVYSKYLESFEWTKLSYRRSMGLLLAQIAVGLSILAAIAVFAIMAS